MSLESFDDQTLIDLARAHYYRCSDESRKSEINHLLTRPCPLPNKDRNELLRFIYFAKSAQPPSMTEMKREILATIGYTGPEPRNGYAYGNSYSGASGNNVNRNELEAIYRWVKAQKNGEVEGKNK